MSEIILGKDILTHKKDFDLPQDFFTFIDPEGINVIIEGQKQEFHGEIRFVGLFKFKERVLPYELYTSLPKETFEEIVQIISIESLKEVN